MSGPRYSIFPAECLADPRCKDVHLRVLATIGTHTDNRGWCTVNQRKLGEACGKSRETINRAIRDLCDMGYLSKRDQVTKANGRTISQYRVLMDRPDETQDVEGVVTPASHPPVTPEDHSPCDVATSQHNDPFFNDHPSLRSDSRADETSFEEVWAAFPKREGERRGRASAVWRKLSSVDRAAAAEAVPRLVASIEANRRQRGEDEATSRQFRVAMHTWLSERGWMDVAASPSSGGFVILPGNDPLLPIIEALRGFPVILGKSGNATIPADIVAQARKELAH